MILRMQFRMILSSSLLLMCLTFAAGAKAQPPPEDPVRRIEQYYLTGQLDQAELEALRLLNKQSGLSDVERAELYRILAFSAVARDDTELARQYFRSALQHNPNMRLNRTLTSPKILSVFDEARVDFKQVRILDRETLIQDLKSYRLRIEGGRRSLLLPGLGQFHKGQSWRGSLFMGSAGVSVIGLAYTQVMVMDARDNYERSEEPMTAAQHYEDYRQYWRWRYGFLLATGSIYVISLLDAFLMPPSEEALQQVSVELVTKPLNDGVAIGLAIRF